MTHDRPIAWLALQEGTPVLASDGSEVGRVTAVVADEQKDIFSGIVLRSGIFEADRLVPADLVGSITDEAVRLRIDAGAAHELETYEG